MKQAFHKLPKIFSQFTNCLITQIDANIYIMIIYIYIYINDYTTEAYNKRFFYMTFVLNSLIIEAKLTMKTDVNCSIAVILVVYFQKS